MTKLEKREDDTSKGQRHAKNVNYKIRIINSILGRERRPRWRDFEGRVT